MRREGYRVYRNTCPRKCYSTCSLLSYVKKGKLMKVEGDPNHGYTLGRLCAHGYALPRYVYHPERLRFPMMQYPRGSGRWRRIDWDEALKIIAEKILSLNSRFHNNLALGFHKGAGNMGLLHDIGEDFFNGLGARNLAERRGNDARLGDPGQLEMPEPESMARAKQFVLWGVNPAVNGLHQMFFIDRARDFGAKLIVIDPVFTPTAAQGDIYLQVKPGTDNLLAMAVAKLLVAEGNIDEDFLLQNTEGWPEYKNYLMEHVFLERAGQVTGVGVEAIRELAGCYSNQAVATWLGGKTLRAVEALAVIAGQVGPLGGGVYSGWRNIRQISPQALLELNDPPLKLLWFTCCNHLKDCSQSQLWQELFQQTELIVTSDLFLTETGCNSDIVLPAAGFAEECDLHINRWHKWVSINEKAIPNFYEAKSDLEIVRMLSLKLNELSPGFSGFPHELSPVEWLRKKLTPELRSLLGISHWRDLLKGPRKLRPQTAFKRESFSTLTIPLYRFEADENRAHQ